MKRTLLIVILFSLSFAISFSQIPNIKDLEKKRKQALFDIENTNRLLTETKKTTSTLIRRISLISSQISSRQQVISILDQELKSITKEQAVTEREIDQLKTELKAKQENYATAIKGMIQKRQSSDKLLFILSGKSFGESLRRMKYIKEYSEWRNDQATEINSKREKLTAKSKVLVETKKTKLALLSQRTNEQAKLKTEEDAYQVEMKEASKQQKSLQADINKKQKQANALNAQIERLIAEEIARQEREAKRIAEEKARIAAQKQTSKPSAKPSVKPGQKEDPVQAPVISPAETQESFNLSNNFAANRGKFPMPVTGRYSIIHRFGQQQHKQWNVTTNSNGIDIKTPSGSDARAIYQGEVSRVIAFPGYNNCVIVRHGGYYSFYGNLQQVYVKQGEKLRVGQSIGKIYTDSETNSTELHFELWKGTTKLNPEFWLKQ